MREPREPKPLGELVGALVAGRGWSERMALGRLRDAWPRVVGALVAGRSEPVRLRDGVLTIRVESGAWANELTLLAPTLAVKVDAFLGGGSVRAVKVTAGPIRSPDPEA